MTPHTSQYGGRLGLFAVRPGNADADLHTGPGRDPAASPIVHAYAYDGARLRRMTTIFPFLGGYGATVSGGGFGY